MAEYTIFGTLAVASPYSSTARTHGTQFDVSATVWVTHIRYHRASTAYVAPVSAAIWTDAGTSPVSGSQITLPSTAATGWIEVEVPTPVKLTPGRYRVGALWNANGQYHGVGSFFVSNDYAVSPGGPILAPGAPRATGNAQGCYTAGTTLAKPTTSSGSKAMYPVDVRIVDVDPTAQVSYGSGSTSSRSGTTSTGRKRGKGTGSTRSLSTAVGVGRRRPTGSGSTTSRLSGLEGRGYGKHKGSGSTVSRVLSTIVGKARRPGGGSTTSRDGGSSNARTRRNGSESNAKSLSILSGGGTRLRTGGGFTASLSRVSGNGKALLGGITRSVSEAVGAGRLKAKATGRLLSTSLSNARARTLRRGKAVTSSRGSSLGKGRPRHYGGGQLNKVSRVTGSGVARIVGAAGEPRPHVGMAIRLFDANGALGEYAPDWRNISFTDQLNADGSVTIGYVKSGINASRLMTDRTEGALFDGDREIPGTRFLITQQSADAVSESADGQTVTLNAPLWVPSRLSEATVYPVKWPATDVPQTNFGAATPGAIIGTLIARAKARGAIPDIVQNFSAGADSNGRAWTKQVTIEIKPGGSIRSVLNTLVEMGVCDWGSNGRELILKNPESGKDLTVGENPLVLQAGRDILDAPVKRDATEYFTCVLVEGEDNTIVEVRHPTEYARRGRIESYVSAGSIRDVGTLRVIGEAHVARAAIPKTENNHTLSLFSQDGPQPWIDYRIGDYVYRSVGGGKAPERLRVSQLQFDCSDDGLVKASITLGDRFLSDVDRLNKKIASLTNGSTGTSAPADNAAKDNKPPAKPTGLIVNSNAYTVDNGTEWGGTTMAAVSCSWVPVTLNTDGSVLNDLDRYEVRWKVVRT